MSAKKIHCRHAAGTRPHAKAKATPEPVVRVIRLPNGRQCRLRTYVAAWKTLRKMPARESVRGFGHFAQPASEILTALRDGMHDRINRHIPKYGEGRKWDHDWQRAAMQCANFVNTPRLIVRWVPQDLKARLAHRITLPGEE